MQLLLGTGTAMPAKKNARHFSAESIHKGRSCLVTIKMKLYGIKINNPTICHELNAIWHAVVDN